MEKKDIRLYFYEHGTLKKWGRGKTHHTIRHQFDSIDNCVEHVYGKIINTDSAYYKSRGNTTFVIVEYYDSYKSEIVCLVNKLNCVYLH